MQGSRSEQLVRADRWSGGRRRLVQAMAWATAWVRSLPGRVAVTGLWGPARGLSSVAVSWGRARLYGGSWRLLVSRMWLAGRGRVGIALATSRARVHSSPAWQWMATVLQPRLERVAAPAASWVAAARRYYQDASVAVRVVEALLARAWMSLSVAGARVRDSSVVQLLKIEARPTWRRRLRFAVVVVISQMLLMALAIAWLIHMLLIAINGSIYFVERNRAVLWAEVAATVLIIAFAGGVFAAQIKRLGERRRGDDQHDRRR